MRRVTGARAIIPAMDFLPGLELNERFYHEVVGPLLARQSPQLRHSAALMGYGSDVLGFDTPISMDHNWGPRMQIFLSPDDMASSGAEIVELFRRSLPFEYLGFPTNYCAPRYDRTQSMEPVSDYPINHLIEVTTVGAYFASYLGTDAAGIRAPRDWLGLGEQKLLELTSGRVFHDGLGALVEQRRRFAFFPHDVLLARLARLWESIEEDEPLVGRTAALGTFDGTKILAARLAETCIMICLYLEGRYLPYRKWLYRSFQTTQVYPEVEPIVMRVLGEHEPGAIEEHLCELYEKIVEIHNRHPQLPRLANRARSFFNRPYKVIFAETIVETLRSTIADPEIARQIASIDRP